MADLKSRTAALPASLNVSTAANNMVPENPSIIARLQDIVTTEVRAHERLLAFRDHLDGAPASQPASEIGMPAGIEGLLSFVENQQRDNVDLVENLRRRF